MDFDKDNYSPGDKVTAKIKVRRPDGEKLLDGSRISYDIKIPTASGRIEELTNFRLLNKQGEYNLTFEIPPTANMKVLSISL